MVVVEICGVGALISRAVTTFADARHLLVVDWLLRFFVNQLDRAACDTSSKHSFSLRVAKGSMDGLG